MSRDQRRRHNQHRPTFSSSSPLVELIRPGVDAAIDRMIEDRDPIQAMARSLRGAFNSGASEEFREGFAEMARLMMDLQDQETDEVEV